MILNQYKYLDHHNPAQYHVANQEQHNQCSWAHVWFQVQLWSYSPWVYGEAVCWMYRRHLVHQSDCHWAAACQPGTDCSPTTLGRFEHLLVIVVVVLDWNIKKNYENSKLKVKSYNIDKLYCQNLNIIRDVSINMWTIRSKLYGP